MTLQRVVSAHAAAGVVVSRRLESMQSHANSRQAGRQAGGSCIVRLGLARPKTGRARLGQFTEVPVMQ